MGILKPKTETKTKQFNLRLDSVLVEEIETIKRDAEAAGLIFDVNEIVTRSLQTAVRQARSELATDK